MVPPLPFTIALPTGVQNWALIGPLSFLLLANCLYLNAFFGYWPYGGPVYLSAPLQLLFIFATAYIPVLAKEDERVLS